MNSVTEHIYYFTGKVLPERAAVSTHREFTFSVSGGADVSPSSLRIQIIVSQIFARMTCPSPILDRFTARNIVEDSVRSILDAAGFVFGRSYGVEIIQYLASDSSADYVFGVDIGVIEGRAVEAGLSFEHLLYMMSTPSSWFFRRALSDFREALKNPVDTGFFSYRAIETLMQHHASSHLPPNAKDKAKWTAFRENYGLSENELLEIKSFADPVRHGNGLEMKAMTGTDRVRLFELAWGIGIKVFLRVYKDNPPPPTGTLPTESR
jgi:hypothetical protein